MAKDPIATERYVALRNALIAIQDDTSAVRSILSSLSDGGAGWIEAAYCELRRSLVQGRLTDAEIVGNLVGVVLEVQDHGIDDELASSSIHRESMNWVTEGIQAILAQDNLVGIEHLERLTEAVYADDSLQWVAWYWLAKAAVDEGQLELAGRAVEEAMGLSHNLDLRARGMSLCRCSEIENQQGNTDQALEHLVEATAVFKEVGDQRGMALAFLALARMYFTLSMNEEGRAAAEEARDCDPDWDEPVVFLSQRALAVGEVDRAAALIKPLENVEPRSPDVARQLYLLAATREGQVDAEGVASYLRVKERPASEEAVIEMQALLDRYPELTQLRETLAWALVRVGRELEAAEHFKALAAEHLPPEIQSSVLLGLGCLANRQFKHRQPGARLRAAASAGAAAPAAGGLQVAEDVASDEEVPVIEATPGGMTAEIPVIEAVGVEMVEEQLSDLDEHPGTIQESIEAVIEFQEPSETHPYDDGFEHALDATFDMSDDLSISSSEPQVRIEPQLQVAPQLRPEPPRKRAEPTASEIAAEPPARGNGEGAARAAASLADSAPQPVKRSSERREEPKAVFTGDLQLFAVPDLLDFLDSSRRTGTLVITSEAGIGAVYLHQGQITGAASPGSSNVGAMLIERGAVTKEQLDEAAERQREQSPDRLLGYILVEMGLVERSTLEEALVAQVKSALLEMVQWAQGRFAFEPDKRPVSETAGEIEIELDCRSLLLDVLRILDEANK